MDSVTLANFAFEATDETLIKRAGGLLQEQLTPEDCRRLQAILLHALWAASFRPVITTFILERFALSLDA